MRILVTGATGFVGKNLLEKLITEKHEIFLLLRKGSTFSDERFKTVYFDDDILQLKSYLIENQIEGIVHLASLFLSTHNVSDIKQLINSNIFLGAAILEASLNTNVKWFLNTGTFWQNYIYDSKEFSPVNLYAATKEAFINLAKYYTAISPIRFSTLKICDTFGANDVRPKIFNLWSRIAESGDEFSMSKGEQYIDILYIDDVIDGFCVLINMLSSDSKVSQEYALYAEKRYTLRQLSELFSVAIGKKLNINWGGRPYREREVMQPWRVGEQLPEWKPQYSVEEGIKRFMRL